MQQGYISVKNISGVKYKVHAVIYFCAFFGKYYNNVKYGSKS